jgi:hypothetical protein
MEDAEMVSFSSTMGEKLSIALSSVVITFLLSNETICIAIIR